MEQNYSTNHVQLTFKDPNLLSWPPTGHRIGSNTEHFAAPQRTLYDEWRHLDLLDATCLIPVRGIAARCLSSGRQSGFRPVSLYFLFIIAPMRTLQLASLACCAAVVLLSSPALSQGDPLMQEASHEASSGFGRVQTPTIGDLDDISS